MRNKATLYIIPVLFLFVIDWIMKNGEDNISGITLRFAETLENLEFADDVCLIISKASNIEKKFKKLIDMSK